MEKLKFIIILIIGVCFIVGCKDKKTAENNAVLNVQISDSMVVADSTIYGIGGEGTAMHTLELKGDDGEVHTFLINMDDSTANIQGGLLNGDRLAVIAEVAYGDTIATTVINLTTLQGKWVSIDRNFEIREGGVVQSNIDSESNPWTNWKIHNGHL